MADYTNLTCKVCGEKFCENDDVVVCHICGTPHHRECYKSLGHCVNEQWHEQNIAYNIDGEREKLEPNEESKEKKKEGEKICSRCGKVNDEQALFCSKCGCPLNINFGAQSEENNPRVFVAPPFMAHNPEDEIEGVKVWKLIAAVKENSFRFISQFKALSQKKSKTSFNFAALLFAPYYFFYRKMYVIGIITFILNTILAIPSTLLNLTNENLSKMFEMAVDFGLNFTVSQIDILTKAAYIAMLLTSALQIVCGLFANYFYLRKCKKICNSVEEEDKATLIEKIGKKGGANRTIIFIFMGIYFISVWAIGFFVGT